MAQALIKGGSKQKNTYILILDSPNHEREKTPYKRLNVEFENNLIPDYFNFKNNLRLTERFVYVRKYR